VQLPQDWFNTLNLVATVLVPYLIWRTERNRRILTKIFDETKKTNSRVTRLEQWQADHLRHGDREKASLDKDMERLEDAVFRDKE
jgi:hypothetical protein